MVFQFYGESNLELFAPWTNALSCIDERQGNRKLVLVIDEFHYLARKNKALLSELQHLIDHKLTRGGENSCHQAEEVQVPEVQEVVAVRAAEAVRAAAAARREDAAAHRIAVHTAVPTGAAATHLYLVWEEHGETSLQEFLRILRRRRL